MSQSIIEGLPAARSVTPAEPVRLLDVAAPAKETLDLESLTPDLCQVVRLRMMGYTTDEMAKMFSLPVPTVNCRLRKAKGILRNGQPQTSRYKT